MNGAGGLAGRCWYWWRRGWCGRHWLRRYWVSASLTNWRVGLWRDRCKAGVYGYRILGWNLHGRLYVGGNLNKTIVFGNALTSYWSTSLEPKRTHSVGDVCEIGVIRFARSMS